MVDPDDGAGSEPAAADAKSPSEALVDPGEDWAGRYRYLLADFENFRRRVERERESLSRHARAAILRALIPLYEGLRKALEFTSTAPAADPVRRGLEMIDRDFQQFFRKEDVTPIAAIGAEFSPEEEEAVGEVPAADGDPEGTVVEIVQQGYRMNGELLWPAKVVIARHPSRADSDERPPDGDAPLEPEE